MSTRNCPGMDSVIKPLDTIPEDKKVRVQRTQSTFDPFEKPTNQVKRVHSENNACINFNKSSSAGKESPKVRRHSSPSSVSEAFPLMMGDGRAEQVSLLPQRPAAQGDRRWLYHCIIMQSLLRWFTIFWKRVCAGMRKYQLHIQTLDSQAPSKPMRNE
ncbi:CDK14 [Cervus elaphus hippelaphus]|uniref:CDK14 n=1 Tax=Cervus elaphus hippelaphus TaxID=46360 RepID=A0A212CJL0_CEREH|nr:CDK14 [Cervus elaphus hippelaphus]